MSYMIEVFYKGPMDETKELALTREIANAGGWISFREEPAGKLPGPICLTYEFESVEDAQRSAELLRNLGEHIEGPVDYGSDQRLKGKRTSKRWQELVNVLQPILTPGTVTTYAAVSQWGYGVPNLNQPVRALLVGARNGGFQYLTNRIVSVTGDLTELPRNAKMQQRKQLQEEGVPFTTAGRIDFQKISPVSLSQKVNHGEARSRLQQSVLQRSA